MALTDKIEKLTRELLEAGKELELTHGEELSLGCSYILNLVYNFNWHEVKDTEGVKNEIRRCLDALDEHIEKVLEGVKPNGCH